MPESWTELAAPADGLPFDEGEPDCDEVHPRGLGQGVAIASGEQIGGAVPDVVVTASLGRPRLAR